MDTRIVNAARPDVVMIESTPRPTPTPARVSFGQVLAAGVGTLVEGAELAASKLPGSPITATAVRGGGVTMSATLPSLAAVGASALDTSAEGPLAAVSPVVGAGAPGVGAASIGASAGAADSSTGIDASLQQSAQLNLYYLQVQQQVDTQNRSFTALSNVLKTEHDTAKSAIGNIHA